MNELKKLLKSTSDTLKNIDTNKLQATNSLFTKRMLDGFSKTEKSINAAQKTILGDKFETRLDNYIMGKIKLGNILHWSIDKIKDLYKYNAEVGREIIAAQERGFEHFQYKGLRELAQGLDDNFDVSVYDSDLGSINTKIKELAQGGNNTNNSLNAALQALNISIFDKNGDIKKPLQLIYDLSDFEIKSPEDMLKLDDAIKALEIKGKGLQRVIKTINSVNIAPVIDKQMKLPEAAQNSRKKLFDKMQNGDPFYHFLEISSFLSNFLSPEAVLSNVIGKTAKNQMQEHYTSLLSFLEDNVYGKGYAPDFEAREFANNNEKFNSNGLDIVIKDIFAKHIATLSPIVNPSEAANTLNASNSFTDSRQTENHVNVTVNTPSADPWTHGQVVGNAVVSAASEQNNNNFTNPIDTGVIHA